MSIWLWLLIGYFGINFIIAVVTVIRDRDYFLSEFGFVCIVFFLMLFFGIPLILFEGIKGVLDL